MTSTVMGDDRYLRRKVALLYGAPTLAAAISIAVVAGLERWGRKEWYGLAVLPLNALLGVAGAAVSGVIGRDRPIARLRGALDCGLFGLILHVFALAGLGYFVVLVARAMQPWQ